MTNLNMTALEKRATLSLSCIMSLRLLGLFMVLPLFSLYAHDLIGATPLLIGIAMGIYGLTQALFQIPFGALSDHIGRRKVISIGLFLFALGSLLAALSDSIYMMIAGRALQGAGAIGSSIMAMIADATRAEQRTKAMAIAGVTIGFSFMIAIMIGPLLSSKLSVSSLFWVALLLSLIALILLFVWVPHPTTLSWHSEVEPERQGLLTLFKIPLLMQLNLGVFLLHAIFTASFIVIPISLQNLAGLPSQQQWSLYVPILFIAFLVTFYCIRTAEKKKQIKRYFVSAIIMISIAQFLFWLFANHLFISAFSLLSFLTAFATLEAFLPSLVSRTVPPSRKGTALGLYSFSQFFGIFIGGTLGGWLYGQFGLIKVYLFCVILGLVWVTMAVKMNTGELDHGKR